jgi:F-type H+-transporting ATPase subunit epsilon
VSNLHVDIVTPESLVFSGEARELRAPGWDGQFGILPGHDSYLSLLRGGICTVVTDAGEQRYIIGRGFAEATPDRVTVLTDSCLDAKSGDKAQAQLDLAAADTELMSISSYSEHHKLVKAKAELAQATLDA